MTHKAKGHKEESWEPLKTLKVLGMTIDAQCTVGGDGGYRVGEIRAGTTSPMPDHKHFKLQ